MPIQITNQMIKDLGKCRFDPVANRKVYYLFGHVLFESMDKHNPYTKRINKSKVLIHDNPVRWMDHAKEQANVRKIDRALAEECLKEGFRVNGKNPYRWSRFKGDLEVGVGVDRKQEGQLNLISAYRYTQAHNPGILKRLLGYLREYVHPEIEGFLMNSTRVMAAQLDWKPEGLRYFRRLHALHEWYKGTEGAELVDQEMLVQLYETVRRTKMAEELTKWTQVLSDQPFGFPDHVEDDWALTLVLPEGELWEGGRIATLELIGFQKETHVGVSPNKTNYFNIDLRQMPLSFFT